MQEIRNPSALAMELRLSCTNPSISSCIIVLNTFALVLIVTCTFAIYVSDSQRGLPCYSIHSWRNYSMTADIAINKSHVSDNPSSVAMAARCGKWTPWHLNGWMARVLLFCAMDMVLLMQHSPDITRQIFSKVFTICNKCGCLVPNSYTKTQTQMNTP